MPILNYTTKIDYEKTIGEITRILVNHGANKIVADYKNKVPVGVTFILEVNGQIIAFALPCNYTGVLAAMKRNRKITRSMCTDEQALRVSWRIVKDWVETQCAITEAGLAEMVEVFLPYAVTQNGNTVYKELEGKGFNQLQLT